MFDSSRMTERKRVHRVFILADGTGETAQKVATAALTQFSNVPVVTEVFTTVRSKVEIREILERAQRESAFVVYTVIDLEHREYIGSCAQELGLETSDLIGGLVVQLSTVFGEQPMNSPGAQYRLDAGYFKRIDLRSSSSCDSRE